MDCNRGPVHRIGVVSHNRRHFTRVIVRLQRERPDTLLAKSPGTFGDRTGPTHHSPEPPQSEVPSTLSKRQDPLQPHSLSSQPGVVHTDPPTSQ